MVCPVVNRKSFSTNGLAIKIIAEKRKQNIDHLSGVYFKR